MGPSGPAPTMASGGKLLDVPILDSDDRVLALEAALREKESELRMLQRDHDDYVASSVEVEHELEVEVHRLEAAKRKNDELLLKAQDDVRTAQLALAAATKEVLHLQRVVDELTRTNSALKTHVRELEQTNDDLERRERELQASVEDLSTRLDDTVEQNVFLQQECDDLLKLSACRPASPPSLVSSPTKSTRPFAVTYRVMESPVAPKRRNTLPAHAYVSAQNSCGPTCAIM
ncbi:hypothetical protein ACHHYP_04428 [Achlya hypogyna]|uniref:Uncharacterized protein n=1 Tax=Achlya hypogyna TaxID=1202772 RepID=A0A1V9ZP81_ACHHY|nr:hypothetical protein ACHHYP_04428 [Achlya hypogyna]